jgi:hypothetical protein
MASPHAIISDGASLAIMFSLTFEERVILEKGFAILTSHPVFAAMTSAAPSMDAQPPANTIRSTWPIWLDE